MGTTKHHHVVGTSWYLASLLGSSKHYQWAPGIPTEHPAFFPGTTVHHHAVASGHDQALGIHANHLWSAGTPGHWASLPGTNGQHQASASTGHQQALDISGHYWAPGTTGQQTTVGTT